MAKIKIVQGYARQGEVLFFKADKGLKPNGKSIGNVIIEGEVSGHKHEVLNGKLFEHPTDKEMMILEAEEGCKVIHPEHGPIPFPKGRYEIKIQREMSNDNKTARRVKD